MGKFITLRDILKKPDPIEERPTFKVLVFHYDGTITELEHITDVIETPSGNWSIFNSKYTYVYKRENVEHIELIRE